MRASGAAWLAAVGACGRIGFATDVDGRPTDAPVLTCADLILVGEASCVGTELQPTSAVEYEAGAAWLPVPYATAGDVTIELTASITPAGTPVADGMAIVLHADPRGTTALGGLGGELGYSYITPSLAFEVDPFANTGELNRPHFGFSVDGVAPISTISAETPFALDDSTPFTIWLEVRAAEQLVVAWVSRDAARPAMSFLEITDVLTRLGPTMWIGITAATGISYATFRVHAVHVEVR